MYLFQIPLVADLPVGENYHDHTLVYAPELLIDSLKYTPTYWDQFKDFMKGNSKSFGNKYSLLATIFLHIEI